MKAWVSYHFRSQAIALKTPYQHPLLPAAWRARFEQPRQTSVYSRRSMVTRFKIEIDRRKIRHSDIGPSVAQDSHGRDNAQGPSVVQKPCGRDNGRKEGM